MSKNFQRTLSIRAPFHASGTTRAAQSLSEADLAGIVGGAGHGELVATTGLSFAVPSATLAIADGLQQMPVGMVDPDVVPWDELTPAKALAIGAELRHA